MLPQPDELSRAAGLTVRPDLGSGQTRVSSKASAGRSLPIRVGGNAKRAARGMPGAARFECLGSGELNVRRALAAVAAGFEVVGHLLIVGEAGEACTFNGADVNENVLAAAIGRDEAEAFGGVEPFHGASGHIRGLLYVSLLA